MKKKLLVLFALVCIILMAIPVSAANRKVIAQGLWDGGPIKWQVTDDGVLTISGTGNIRAAYDPTTYAWKKYSSIITHVIIEEGVKTLPAGVFQDMVAMESISISSTVKNIGKSAFSRCSNLQSIHISSGITKIEEYAFYGCDSLSEITFAEDSILESIGNNAFYNTPLTELTIPSSVRTIGNSAFECCDKLTSLTLQEGLEEIGKNAFADCVNLTGTYYLPETLTKIGYHAFLNCNQFTHAIINSNSSLGIGGVFSDTNSPVQSVVFGGKAYSAGGFRNCKKLTSVTLSSSIKSVGGFEGCVSLTSIYLPEGVETIGLDAFRASGLREIVIPNSVTDIDMGAFQKCSDLQIVKCGTGLERISNHAFKNCQSLEKVDLGGVRILGGSAFENCTALSTIHWSESLKEIQQEAFYNCDSLESVTIPETTTWLAQNAFAECDNLREVVFLGNAPGFGNHVFDNVTATVYYPADNETWTQEKMQQYGGKLTWIPIHDHEYEDRIVPPTCVDGGYTVHICKICEKSYTDNLTNATGHTMGPWEITVEPTEEQNGSKSRACANCDYVQTVTITINGIPGDMDDSGTVDVDDVLALLWHVLFPEEYPISVDADFDANGTVDVDDVLALLWHVLFPEEYPLEIA